MIANSGYGKERCRRIIVAGLMGYERRIKESKRTGKPLHMGANDSKEGRRRKKLLNKSTWFKKKKRRVRRRNRWRVN